MPKFKLIVSILSFTIFCRVSFGDTCEVSYEILGSKKINLKHTFEPNKEVQVWNFSIPKTKSMCRISYFGLKSGTMISCSNIAGQYGDFVQSDRSVINEVNPKNNLSFRIGKNQFYLKSKCY